jgi:hypothetical protein
MILSRRGNSKEKKREIGGKGYEVKGSCWEKLTKIAEENPTHII